MKIPKIKAKKSVKKAQAKSAGQIAVSRLACPGVGMFRTTPRIISGPRWAGPTATPMMVLQLIALNTSRVYYRD